MASKKNYGINTRAIHTNTRVKLPTGDIMPPLHLSTTFENTQPGEYEYFYGRSGNPTRELFERTMASLEGVENYDEMHSFAMASGMAAVTLIGELVKPGENVVITQDVYGGTTSFFSKIATKRGIEVNFCDLDDLDKLNSLLNDKTKLLWFESPSNPRIKLFDYEKYAEIAHKNSTLLVTDATFSTPFITRPLELGADIVFHSTTKYIGGHSDSLGGVVTTNIKEIWEQLHSYQKTSGAIMSPFDAYLCQRGLYTVGVRLEVHSKNAHKIAEYLETSKHIKEVFYPGLKSNPNYSIAEKQMAMFGGMLSFVSISTILLFTTIPAGAIRPSPDRTMPNGRLVTHSPKNTPPVDRIMADIVTIACQPELNWTINTITISSIEMPNAVPRKLWVSAISSSSPPNCTSTAPFTGVSASDWRSLLIRSTGSNPLSTLALIYI